MNSRHTDIFVDSGLQFTMEWQDGLLTSCGVRRPQGLESAESLQSPDAREWKRLFGLYMAGEAVIWPDPPYDWKQVRPFQERILRLLLEVGHGQTVTYGELARRAGSPKGARAVGLAMHTNPWGLIVPCHRVLGAGGKLTGYAGGLDIKTRLLQLEGMRVDEERGKLLA